MTSDESLQQGIAAYRAGQVAKARDLFLQTLKLDENNEQAWLWLSGTVETDVERRACLERVLAINPANQVARQGLERLGVEVQQPVASAKPQVAPLPTSRAKLSEASDGVFPATPSPDSPEPESLQPAAPPPSPGPAGPAVPAKGGDGSSWLFWLAAAGLALVFVCIVVAVLYQMTGAGLQLGGTLSAAEEQRITGVVYENIAAHDAESIERYLAVMHSKSPGYDDLREVLAQTYALYDLDVKVSNVKVLKASSNRAEVSFILETRKVSGPAFRDNRIEGVFILRKEDGKWKLYDQEIDNVEYLN